MIVAGSLKVVSSKRVTPCPSSARPVDLGDLKLGVLLGEGRLELKARGGAEPDRVDAGEPVVAHEVIRVRRARGQIADEVEDLLPGSGDDGGDGDLAHGRAAGSLVVVRS